MDVSKFIKLDVLSQAQSIQHEMGHLIMDAIFRAKMTNNLNEMKNVINDLNDFLHSHQVDGWMFYAVNLAIEEPLANIINHGCNKNKLQTIDVEVRINAGDISILLTDDGMAFNPLSIPHLDMRKPALERPTGGLGMHIVRNIMQTMWYERKDGKNFFEIHLDR